jgi:UDP-N-acetylglucosamine--N-acetylmuramyl-(pentapeptide) pyrophosphoryl-undecaprenol N-acetylglucosamine transferase
MRVYFGVCGVGLGHVGRCIPVAKRLRHRGDHVLFSTYKDACDYVARENFPLCKAPSISYAIRPDGGVDFRKTTADPGIFSTYIFLTQVQAELEFMRGFNPDFVFSDSRLSSLVAAKLLGIPAVTVLNTYKVTIPRERRFLTLAQIADGGILTIIGESWALGKKILIPDFPLPNTLSLANLGIPPGRRRKIEFIGPVLPVRPEDLPDRKVLRRRLGYSDELLIFVPISGSTQDKEYLSLVLRRLLQALPDKYRIVMSLGEPGSSVTPVTDGNITVHQWLDNRFEYLKACDLVISRAGLGTLSQAICYGKPLVVVPTPSQTEQLNNAKRAMELGVAKVLHQKDLDRKQFTATIQEMFTLEGYVKTAEALQTDVSQLDATEAMVHAITRRGDGS